MSSENESPTQLLDRAHRGDASAAARLLPVIYDELRALAEKSMRRERPGHTLQPTALVHEAFLRLVNQTSVDWSGRTHFFAVAASQIRRVLVDYSRRRGAARRGEGWQRVQLDEGVAAERQPDVDVLVLDEALERLRRLDERQARVVELRFFGGLSVDETAQALGVSPRTVDGDWQMARAWLRREMSRSQTG